MDFLRLNRREKRALRSDRFKCFVSSLAADQSERACDRRNDSCDDSSDLHVFSPPSMPSLLEMCVIACTNEVIRKNLFFNQHPDAGKHSDHAE